MIEQLEIHLPPRSTVEILKDRLHFAAVGHLAAVEAGDSELMAATAERAAEAARAQKKAGVA